jgi:hypothetical protein
VNEFEKQNLWILATVFVFAVLLIMPVSADEDGDFVRGIVFAIDGEDYYFAGAPDGPNGEVDVPGHSWIEVTAGEFVGLHYNTGPGGAEQWWSSDAEDGELLFFVEALIDTWTPQKAAWYASRGYVHYHEMVSVEDGTVHPEYVVWLRHTALGSFTFDGGPLPEMGHDVTPGVDWNFMLNNEMPYMGEEHE